MSDEIIWFTMEDVSEKYSLKISMLIKWVEAGLLCSKEADNGVVMVNIDELKFKVRK